MFKTILKTALWTVFGVMLIGSAIVPVILLRQHPNSIPFYDEALGLKNSVTEHLEEQYSDVEMMMSYSRKNYDGEAEISFWLFSRDKVNEQLSSMEVMGYARKWCIEYISADKNSELYQIFSQQGKLEIYSGLKDTDYSVTENGMRMIFMSSGDRIFDRMTDVQNYKMPLDMDELEYFSDCTYMSIPNVYMSTEGYTFGKFKDLKTLTIFDLPVSDTEKVHNIKKSLSTDCILYVSGGSEVVEVK